MIEFDKLSLENLAKRCRKNILDSSLSAGASSAHFGGGLSIVEILTVLYGSIMNHKPSEPLWEERDRLILSKGHGCLGLYAVLAEFKYISHDELLSFEKSPLQPITLIISFKGKGPFLSKNWFSDILL